MAVKRTTKLVKSPAGAARASVRKRIAKKTTTKKTAAKKDREEDNRREGVN